MILLQVAPASSALACQGYIDTPSGPRSPVPFSHPVLSIPSQVTVDALVGPVVAPARRVFQAIPPHHEYVLAILLRVHL